MCGCFFEDKCNQVNQRMQSSKQRKASAKIITRGNEHHNIPSYMKNMLSMAFKFYNYDVVHSLSGQRLMGFGTLEDLRRPEPPAKVGRHVRLELKAGCQVRQMNHEPRLPQSYSKKYLWSFHDQQQHDYCPNFARYTCPVGKQFHNSVPVLQTKDMGLCSALRQTFLAHQHNE